MTSDAKIGLLLGLVFIFVIAFIINGLPNLRGETGNNELTTNMVNFSGGSLGLAEKERKAQETLNWRELLQKETFNLDELQRFPEEGEGEVRSIIALPTSGAVTEGAGEEGEAEQGMGAIRAEVVSLGEAVKDVGVVKLESPKVSPRIYVVVDGDNLGSIAKKVYGAEEGNKQKNVIGIFEANRNQLKSPHEIFVGQKLVIPAVAVVAASAGGGVFPETDFEQVKSIGRKHISDVVEGGEQGKWYVVQQGDSLWKIAAAQLGKGGRFREIAELNANVLASEDIVAVGTRLRIPVR